MAAANENTTDVRSVLFDLDGTLADTAPDMAGALNRLLAERGRPALPAARIRPLVSHGAIALLEMGFGITAQAPGFQALRERYLELYRADLCRDTRLFPGIPALLDSLQRAGLNWGIVTNKPAWLTDPLVEELGLTGAAACVVSGDTTARRKPHPDPLYLACRLAGSSPQQCLYVGDAQRDIEAGVQAGMRTLIAAFGYIGEDEQPHCWGADGTVDSPAGVLHWLNRHARLQLYA